MVADTIDAITRNMRIAGTVAGVGRDDVYEYPVEALREAVVNALMHRDYSPQARGEPGNWDPDDAATAPAFRHRFRQVL
jgi:ATP-dependent DNA helicase RecG